MTLESLPALAYSLQYTLTHMLAYTHTHTHPHSDRHSLIHIRRAVHNSRWYAFNCLVSCVLVHHSLTPTQVFTWWVVKWLMFISSKMQISKSVRNFRVVSLRSAAYRYIICIESNNNLSVKRLRWEELHWCYMLALSNLSMCVFVCLIWLLIGWMSSVSRYGRQLWRRAVGYGEGRSREVLQQL